MIEYIFHRAIIITDEDDDCKEGDAKLAYM
jgi:hypothetical protein